MLLTDASMLTQGLGVLVGRGTAFMFHNAFPTTCSTFRRVALALRGVWTLGYTAAWPNCCLCAAVRRSGRGRKSGFYEENKTKWRWMRASYLLHPHKPTERLSENTHSTITGS